MNEVSSNISVGGSYVHVLSNEIFIGDSANLNECTQLVRLNNNMIGIGGNGVNGEYETLLNKESLKAPFVRTRSIESTKGTILGLLAENIKTNTLEMQQMLMQSSASTRFLHMTTEYYSVYDKSLNSDNPMADENRKVYLGFEQRNKSYYPSLLMGINGVGADGIVGTTYLNASHYPPNDNPRKYPNSYISYGAKVGNDEADRCSLDFMNGGGESHLISKGDFKCYMNNAATETFGVNESLAYAKAFKSNSYSTYGTTCQFYVNGVTSGSDYNRILQYGLSQNFGNAPADNLATFMIGKNTIMYDGSELHIKDTSNYKNIRFNRANVSEVLATKINSGIVDTDTFAFAINTKCNNGTKAKIVTFADSENYNGAPSPGVPTLDSNGSQIFFGGEFVHLKKGSSYQSFKCNKLDSLEVVSPKINSQKVDTDSLTFDISTKKKNGTNHKIVTFADSESFNGSPAPGVPSMQMGSNQIYYGDSAVHFKKGSAYQEIWAKAIVPKTSTTFNLNKLNKNVMVEQDGFIGIDLEKVVSMQQDIIESLKKDIILLKEKVGL